MLVMRQVKIRETDPQFKNKMGLMNLKNCHDGYSETVTCDGRMKAVESWHESSAPTNGVRFGCEAEEA